MKRVVLLIAGQVQGVGYRAWVCWQAKKLVLTGWVKNKADGAVAIVAEGSKTKLEEFIKACQRGPEVAWVTKVEKQWEAATGEYASFTVIY